MRYWLESLWRFLLFAFSPLRHIETLREWVELFMMFLLFIGIIATPVIGFSLRWANWPLFTVLFIAILFLYAGVRLQYRLSRVKFYLRIWNISYRLLCNPKDPKDPYKGAISFDLTISNQQNNPRGISRFLLEIELEDGNKKALRPMNPDNVTEAEITLYLQPHQPKTIRLNFVYDEPPIHQNDKLYVFDDRGAYCFTTVNVKTIVKMAKKSKSRSGEYLIE